MDISVVIPVYNGEKTLRELYRKVKTELNGYLSFEVIFVYDCGRDESWEIIKELARNEPDHIRGYCFDKNYGQHFATSFGLKKACGNFILTLDEDAQHDPKYIPSMIKKMEDKNLDLIYGQFSKLEQPFFRVIMSLFLRKVLCLMIPDLPRDYSAYRLFSKELANKIFERETYCFFLDAEVGRLSRNHGNLLIEHFKRLNGSTSYTIIKLLKQSLDVLFKYSKLFRWIYNSVLVVVLLCLVYFFYMQVLDPNQYLLVSIILLISFVTFIFIRRMSLQRVHRKLIPIVVEQTNKDK